MTGNFHVRFGERGGETHWLQNQKVRSAPTLRSGSLLLKVGDEAGTPVTLYGQEKDAATSSLARMNMILHNNPTALIMQGNNQLGGLKGDKTAIAEIIENNVRRKIIKEHLNDPAFYEKMSTLLDEIIAARKAKAIEYEEYLKRMGELTNKVEVGHSDETPQQLNTPGKRALYNNLKKPQANDQLAEDAGVYHVDGDPALTTALEIDTAIKKSRPDGWRGVQAREQVIKAALFNILKDRDEVERIFKIIFQQHEY